MNNSEKLCQLENCLVENAIVLGMDENTGLSGCKRLPKTFSDNFTHDKKGTIGPYQLHVLGIFTSTTAVFPASKVFVDGEPYYDRFNTFCPAVDTESTKKERLRRSMSYATRSGETVPQSITNEVIESLATFCFPDGGYISQCERKPQILCLVLTNIEGERSYVMCLIVDRKFQTYLDVKEGQELDLEVFHTCSEDKGHTDNEGCEMNADDNGDELDLTTVYVPLGLCLISKYPYFNVMKHCLSTFAQSHASSMKSWAPVLDIVTTVFHLAVPPAGPVTLQYKIGGLNCTIPSPDEPGRRPLDIELHWPFLSLSIEDIIVVVTCILTQQRIIFLSSSYSILTLTIESFFTYIEPFQWYLTYVPLLPNILADLIEAPGPFIMGCHSTLRKQVNLVRKMEEIPGIVLVDLDEGKVDVDIREKVPSMPDGAGTGLLRKLKRLKYHFDVNDVENTKSCTVEELMERRAEFFGELAKELKSAFLNAMVNLFGETLAEMRLSGKFFNAREFIESRLEEEVDFYNAVCSSFAFERFIYDRLENHEIRDAFFILSENFFSLHKTISQRKRSSSNISTLSRRTSSRLISSLLSFEKEIVIMPPVSHQNVFGLDYFQECANLFTTCIEGTKPSCSKRKASYYYLRGMMHMACGKPVLAVEDYVVLHSIGKDLFPKLIVTDLKNCLSEVDQEELKKKDCYKAFEKICKYQGKRETLAKPSRNRLPLVAIDKKEFIDRVKNHRIAVSDQSAEWLFYLITGNKPEEVTPSQFEFLFKMFLDNEKQLRSFEPAESKESVLAVSQLVNTCKGMGKLIMTMQKLYFVPQGSRGWTSIIQLHDIKEVIKFKHYVVFPPGVAALRIISKDTSFTPFFACLKEERDLWACLLKEMAIGHETSYAYKDPMIIEIASNNVVLANVIAKMGKSMRLVEGVCTYVRQGNSEKDKLSEETRESLERRLDPSELEASRASVKSVLYVQGRYPIGSGTLWCGLGSGSIIVYETTSWTCVSELRFARSHIGCLLLVGDNVWAGSFDKRIYVIDVETRKCHHQLTMHSSFITDLTLEDDNSQVVWSASCNGELIQWSQGACEPVRETLKLKGAVRLSKLIFASDKLWCITNDTVFVLYPEKNSNPQRTITAVSQEGNQRASFGSACKLSENQIWVAGNSKGQLFIIDTETYDIEEKRIKNSASFNVMVYSRESVWVGCKDGQTLVIDPLNFTVLREMNAHSDSISCMCLTKEGHVATGSLSKDGKICIWNAEEKDRYESAGLLGYDVVDAKRVKCSCK